MQESLLLLNSKTSVSWVAGINGFGRILRYACSVVINIQWYSAIPGMANLSTSVLTLLILEVFRVLQKC